MTDLAYCGLICSDCDYREKTNCPTCKTAGGKMFWGSCDVAKCCIEKKLENCGHCSEFPCDLLNDFAFDSEHSDNGQRIENLRNQ